MVGCERGHRKAKGSAPVQTSRRAITIDESWDNPPFFYDRSVTPGQGPDGRRDWAFRAVSSRTPVSKGK